MILFTMLHLPSIGLVWHLDRYDKLKPYGVAIHETFMYTVYCGTRIYYVPSTFLDKLFGWSFPQ